jgi:hypothetical protein
MGELPTLTHVFPLGGSRNEQRTFELYGVHLPVTQETLSLSDAGASIIELCTTDDKGMVSNSQPILINDAPSVIEVEPNNGNNNAQMLKWPICVDGRIGKPGDVDTFGFEVTKNNQKLLFNVYARRLNSPMDSNLDLVDAKGKWMTGNDDTVDDAFPLITHHADSRLLYTFRKGRYYFRIRETQGKGGDEYAYRVVVSEPQPDFELRLMPINRSIAPGSTAELTAQVIRAPGFNDAVDLSFGNLPQGMIIRGARIPKGEDVARMTITAPDKIEGTLLSPTLTGTATVDGQTITRTASPAQEVMQAFIYMHRPITEELLLAVSPRQYFSLTLADSNLPVVEVPLNGEVEVAFNIQREPKNKRPVRLVGYNPPRGIGVKPATIKPEETQGIIKITASKGVKVGYEQNIIIHGEMKQGKKQRIDIPAPAVTIRVVEAAPEAN